MLDVDIPGAVKQAKPSSVVANKLVKYEGLKLDKMIR